MQYPLVTMGMILGGSVRVGLEDNIYLSRGVLAKSNGEVVEKAVRIANELGREIATLDEARKLLKLTP
jgi:3-keto-5-aminohexanoate cleavage enzyme